MTWSKGQSGNPKGRPKGGNTLAAAIRRKVDPDELVEEVMRTMKETTSEATRMACVKFLTEWSESKPAQKLEVGHAGEFEQLSDADLQAEIELVDKELAQLADGDDDGAENGGIEDAEIVE